MGKNELKIQTEAEQAAAELYESQIKFKEYEKKYNERRKELQNIIQGYINKKGMEYFKFLANTGMFKKANSQLRVRNVVSKKIIWDTNALKKKLNKEAYNKVVTKTYTINDMEGLIEYLKSCGVNPKAFKSFLTITENVNQKMIDDLGAQGDIDIKKLQGCYEVVENAGYVKVTECKEEEE